MAVRVGFHLEGHDHLIFRSLLAKVLGWVEDDIHPEVLDADQLMGWQQVLESIPRVLKKFYGQCCQFVVLGIDNDGNENLQHTGQLEDSSHPRHWNHAPGDEPACRYCQLGSKIEAVRPELHWLPEKPGTTWPVIVTVPVESIEAWLLVIRSVLESGFPYHRAERMDRHTFKSVFYGRPTATRDDVQDVALPFIRRLTPELLKTCRGHSKSFDLFVSDVLAVRAQIQGARDCYAPGDSAAEENN